MATESKAKAQSKPVRKAKGGKWLSSSPQTSRAIYRVVRPLGGSGGTYIKKSQRILAVEYVVTLLATASFAIYSGEIPDPAVIFPATLAFAFLGLGTEFTSTQQLAVLFGGVVTITRLMTKGSYKGAPAVTGIKALMGAVTNLEGVAVADQQFLKVAPGFGK